MAGFFISVIILGVFALAADLLTANAQNTCAIAEASSFLTMWGSMAPIYVSVYVFSEVVQFKFFAQAEHFTAIPQFTAEGLALLYYIIISLPKCFCVT